MRVSTFGRRGASGTILLTWNAERLERPLSRIKLSLAPGRHGRTSKSPKVPQFGNEFAHYYRFGEIFHGKKLIQVDGQWEYAGDDIAFPDCYPVKQVPAAGYPGGPGIEAFDQAYGTLIRQLQDAWSGHASSLGNAVGTMFGLTSSAQNIVTQPLPDGSGNYGPDFKVPAAAGGAAAASFARDIP